MRKSDPDSHGDPAFPNAHPDPPKDDGTDKTAYELKSKAYQQVYGK